MRISHYNDLHKNTINRTVSLKVIHFDNLGAVISGDLKTVGWNLWSIRKASHTLSEEAISILYYDVIFLDRI